MIVVFVNVLILFMLMFVGYAMGKRQVIPYPSIGALTTVLIDIAIPCTIVVSMIRPFSKELMSDTFKVFIYLMAFHLAMAGISYLLTKIFKVEPKKIGPWIYAMVFSNNGFIGYPLMLSLYGQDGLFIMAIGNVAQNILLFSLGIKIININYNSDEKFRIKDIFITRQNLAVVIGLTFFFTQIVPPEPIFKCLQYLANLTVPLSMLVVGLSMSRYNPKVMISDFEAYRMAFCRMIVIPAILILAFKFFGIDANMDLPFAILFFTAALPSPAFTAIMAEKYNTNIEFASKCVFITTIISVLTVPLFAGLL